MGMKPKQEKPYCNCQSTPTGELFFCNEHSPQPHQKPKQEKKSGYISESIGNLPKRLLKPKQEKWEDELSNILSISPIKKRRIFSQTKELIRHQIDIARKEGYKKGYKIGLIEGHMDANESMESKGLSQKELYLKYCSCHCHCDCGGYHEPGNPIIQIWECKHCKPKQSKLKAK